MPKTIKKQHSKTDHIDVPDELRVEKINLRKFKNTDLTDVADIIQFHLNNIYSKIYSNTVINFYKKYHSVENIQSDAIKGIMLVAEYKGQVIGTGTLLNDYISRVFIKAGFQKKGIGQKIMIALEKYAQKNGIRKVRLDAVPGSTDFYKKLNYVLLCECADKINNTELLEYCKMEKEII